MRSVPGAVLGDSTDLRRQWAATQARFVDDPESAVREADALVTTTIAQLTSAFDEQRARLEETWATREATTDDLRAAFQTYRDFFDRLLSA